MVGGLHRQRRGRARAGRKMKRWLLKTDQRRRCSMAVAGGFFNKVFWRQLRLPQTHSIGSCRGAQARSPSPAGRARWWTASCWSRTGCCEESMRRNEEMAAASERSATSDEQKNNEKKGGLGVLREGSVGNPNLNPNPKALTLNWRGERGGGYAQRGWKDMRRRQ